MPRHRRCDYFLGGGWDWSESNFSARAHSLASSGVNGRRKTCSSFARASSERCVTRRSIRGVRPRALPILHQLGCALRAEWKRRDSWNDAHAWIGDLASNGRCWRRTCRDHLIRSSRSQWRNRLMPRRAHPMRRSKTRVRKSRYGN